MQNNGKQKYALHQDRAEAFILAKAQTFEETDFDKLYQFESELMERVRRGLQPVNTWGIPPVNNEYFLRLLTDGKKYAKSQFSTLTGLATSHAIGGGMNPRTAFILWEYYHRLADKTNEAEELDALAERMLEDFAGRCAQDRLPENLPSRLRAAVLYLRQHIGSPVKIEETASAVSCSRSQLDRDFRKYLGCSPKEFLTRERITQAEQFMKYSDISVTELGAILGFSSTSHFCNVYRKATGHTLRKRHEPS